MKSEAAKAGQAGRDPAFLAKLVGEGERIDCAFLDPPYNVKINGHANARGRIA